MKDPKEPKKPITKAQQLAAAVTFVEPVGVDITYTHALFSQCCLPVNKPKSDSWIVKNGKVGIGIVAGLGKDFERLQVPYGSYARIALAHIHNKIVRSGSLDTACQVDLGDSMRGFFSENGMKIGGKQGTLLQQQMMNIAQANITLSFFGDKQQCLVNVPKLASHIVFWLEKDDQQQTIWQPQMTITREYAELVRQRAVPLDMRARMGILAEGKRGAARAMDIYDWLAYRLPKVRAPKGVFIPFEGANNLHSIFGIEIKAAKKFKQQFIEALKLAVKYYPDARVSLEENGIRLFGSPPAVPYGSSKPIYLKT